MKKNYDAILSNSVFSYFPDTEYAWQVLEKMYTKARRAIGLIDIHDREKKESFIAFRKANIANYEEKYAGLQKLFYDRDFFMDFATQHGLDIVFIKSEVDGYWNNNFVFNCYFYKP